MTNSSDIQQYLNKCQIQRKKIDQLYLFIFVYVYIGMQCMCTCMCRCTHAEAREGIIVHTLSYSFEVRSLSEPRPHVFRKRPMSRNPCVSVAISTGVPGMPVPCLHFIWILRSVLWLSCTHSKYMRYTLPWAELYLLVCYWYFVYVGNYLNKNITIIIYHNVW